MRETRFSALDVQLSAFGSYDSARWTLLGLDIMVGSSVRLEKLDADPLVRLRAEGRRTGGSVKPDPRPFLSSMIVAFSLASTAAYEVSSLAGRAGGAAI